MTINEHMNVQKKSRKERSKNDLLCSLVPLPGNIN